MARRLLVVDDDVELCALVSEFLMREGFDVECANTGDQGLEAAMSGQHEAIVLDVMLPHMNGFELLRQIRTQKRTPILMLTARGDHVDRIVGLEMGADDYIPKPFDPRELVARIRAVLRRADAAAEPADAGERIVAGAIEIDLAAHEARSEARRLELTAVEFEMLTAFARAYGRVVSREELSQVALRRPFDPRDRSVDMYVSKLRRKLGAHAIRTVRSAGYMLVRPSGDRS